MVSPALRSHIASALYDATLASLNQVFSAELFPITRSAVQSSLRLNLKGAAISYVSPLPLQLAAQCSWQNFEDIILKIPAARLPQNPLTNQAWGGLASAIWHQTEIERLPSGQWQLIPHPAGLRLWLHHWDTYPTEGFEPTPLDVFKIKSALPRQGILAQQLQLHPLVVVQHVYSRCYQLHQHYRCRQASTRGEHPPKEASQWFHPDETPGQYQSHPGEMPEQHQGGFDSRDLLVLGQLIQLVDQLDEVPVSSRNLLRTAYVLAEVTHTWLGGLAPIKSINTTQANLLAGVQKSLYVLLELQFNCPLPRSL